jgi:prepilin-type processing-associated H-X9-DG protein
MTKDSKAEEVGKRISPFDVFNLALVAGIVGFVAFSMLTIPAGGSPPPYSTCRSNVGQLTLGMIMYSSDFDDKAPPRDAWMEVIDPYIKNKDLLTCPLIAEKKMPGHGYAFNSLLERKDIAHMKDAATTPMIYDSINYGPNASDPVNSLPNPGRHDGKNVIGYVDGHAAGQGSIAPPPLFEETATITSVSPLGTLALAGTGFQDALLRAG